MDNLPQEFRDDDALGEEFWSRWRREFWERAFTSQERDFLAPTETTMTCPHCHDTRTLGRDAYGNGVPCRHCAPTIGVSDVPSPPDAAMQDSADRNTKALGDWLAAGKPPLTAGPAGGITADVSATATVEPEVRLSADDVTQLVNNIDPAYRPTAATETGFAAAFRAWQQNTREGQPQCVLCDGTGYSGIIDGKGVPCVCRVPEGVVTPESLPEDHSYVPYVRRGSSEVITGPLAVVVRSETPLTTEKAKRLRDAAEQCFRRTGAAVPPIIVADKESHVNVVPAVKPSAGWVHLPGLSLNGQQVTHVQWTRPECLGRPDLADVPWLPRVWLSNGDDPVVLTPEQAAAMKTHLGLE